LKKIIIFVLAIGVILTFAGCGEENNSTPEQSIQQPPESTTEQPADSASGEAGTPPEATPVTTEMAVFNMVCVNCVNKITAVVSEIEGVVEVSVDLAGEKVTVEHSAELDVSIIVKAIEAEGFNVP